MNSNQPNTTPTTDIERYYEALYWMKLAKPGSSQEEYWKNRAADLEYATLLQIKQ